MQNINPMLLIDYYKAGHVFQYPEDITQVWSNWTARSSRIEDQNFVIHFGLQYYIQEYLIKQWNENFFDRSWSDIEEEYLEWIAEPLNISEPNLDHIRKLWIYGKLPIRIYSLPEGSKVPLGVPSMVITNTEPWAFWLPNYLETSLSNILWKPTTSATTAYRFRKLFEKYARIAGETDLSFIDWQGHDFAMRGMSGIEDSILSGMGHLLSFRGTDTVPALVAAKEYYSGTLGGSVPATEHSVMCAGAEYDEHGNVDEFKMFDRLISEIYPEGIVSIVSDSFDLWKVCTDYIPRLKEKILARNGKIVIRPDSGNPLNIVCGESWGGIKPYNPKEPKDFGVLRLLKNALGVMHRERNLPELINNCGVIYGDAITYERANDILNSIVYNLKMSPFNMVFGIGSFTYQYCTRDTYGFAMKATAVRKNTGEIVSIFKDPVTDEKKNSKKSLKGIPSVYRTDKYDSSSNQHFFVQQMSSEEELNNCEYNVVFENGILKHYDTFEVIKKRVIEE